MDERSLFVMVFSGFMLNWLFPTSVIVVLRATPNLRD
jgi:hypothetical protein